MKVVVKDWFFNKMQDEACGVHLVHTAVQVIDETAKAYKLEMIATTYDGEFETTKAMWCPKSCTMTEEEYKADEQAQVDRFQAGCEAYEKLLTFAKDNGVKGVRKGMRKETILAKVEAAGLQYIA